jgi:hypothetical protein
MIPVAGRPAIPSSFSAPDNIPQVPSLVLPQDSAPVQIVDFIKQTVQQVLVAQSQNIAHASDTPVAVGAHSVPNISEVIWASIRKCPETKFFIL